MPDLSVDLAPGREPGLKLANPVMTASGTFGYGLDYAGLIDVERLGAVVCKGTTLRPRPGNPAPRLVETPCGLLNSIGMENIGIEAVRRDLAPVWAGWRVRVVVNLLGETAEEYGELAGRLDGLPGVSALELNISCPNIAAGGLEFGTDPRAAAAATASARRATSLPIIVKLSPNVGDITEIARAVVEAGADALTVANTLKGMAIDTVRKRPVLPLVSGGLSGPAIRPVSLYLAYRVARAVAVPVIGCGGISSANDALQFIMAGASAVQVGTGVFVSPGCLLEVIEGLGRYLEEQGIERLADLVGAAARDH